MGNTKLGKVKRDQTKRINELESKTEEYTRKALLIQDNIEDVEKAILIIRSAVANSMDWSELGRIVKEEKKNGDRIAEIIHKLHLQENHISLLLSNIPYDSSEEELTGEPEVVEVDISLSAHGNVTRYFEMKKSAQDKKRKTEASVNQALKAAQKKAERAIKQVKVSKGIQKLRKQLWFEKFYWFLSSDNYIIISGRDAQQNELIVKRYMQKADLYVHADIVGASSCVIKNPSGKVVPPMTLEQAGTMAICRSAAWNAKVVTSAYWVYHHQVSKTAPTGEFLVTGSFMIRGKKNFLPPVQLVMGFGFIFRVDPSCVEKHLGERRPKLLDALEEEQASRQRAEEQQPGTEGEQDESIIIEEPTQPEEPSDTQPLELQPSVPVEESTIVTVEETEPEKNEPETIQQPDEKENPTPEPEDSTPNEQSDVPQAEEPKVESKKAEKFQPAHLGIPEKYRIDFSMGEEEEEEEEEDDDSPVATKKRIPKRDRKLMKKGIDPGSVTKTQDNPAVTPNKKKEPAAGAPQQLTRRQKTKQKKIKKKYADQDEEERQLKLKILGSAGQT